MSTAENLKKIRTYFTLSMSAISRSIGISRNSWSRYERGLCRPKIETARKILNWLDTKLPTREIKMVFEHESGLRGDHEVGELRYIYPKEEKSNEKS